MSTLRKQLRPEYLSLKIDHVENTAATLHDEHAVPEDDARDILRQAGQMRIAGIRQGMQLLSLSRRKRAATGQLFLDSRRQTLEVITGETSIQNITVTFGEDIVVTAAQVSPMVVIIVIVINRGQKHLTPMFSMNVVTHEDRGMMQLIEVVLDTTLYTHH